MSEFRFKVGDKVKFSPTAKAAAILGHEPGRQHRIEFAQAKNAVWVVTHRRSCFDRAAYYNLDTDDPALKDSRFRTSGYYEDELSPHKANEVVLEADDV